MRDHAQANTRTPTLSTPTQHAWLGALVVSLAQSLLIRRWLVPVPIILIITVLSIPTSTSAEAIQAPANGWDGIFSVLANQYIIVYLATPLLLYLVGDLAPESSFGDFVLLRLGSRRAWWLAKVLTLAAEVLAYLLLLLGIVVGLASFVLPWKAQWSTLALQNPDAINLPYQALAHSPLGACVLTLLLLGLGWFCVGLVVMIVSLLFHTARAGFVVGMLIVIVAIVVLHSDVAPPYSNIFINNHLLFSLHAFGDPSSAYPSLLSSVAYWIGWMLVLFVAGLWLSTKHDFLRRAE